MQTPEQLTDALLTLHEGKRSTRYWDPIGKVWTIGKGHNLGPGEPWAYPPCAAVVQVQKAANLPSDDQWTDAAIDLQLHADITKNCAWLWTKPWWALCGAPRQAALNDMAFNLGEARDQQFTTFFGLVAVGDWAAAADDLLNHTLVGHKLHKRYSDLAKILTTGSCAGVLPEVA